MWHMLEDMLFKMNQGRCDPVFDLVRKYQVMRKADQDEDGFTKEEGCSTNSARKKKKQISSCLPMSRVLL